jgi:inosine-uridine nucleoside N-ribohydrolase
MKNVISFLTLGALVLFCAAASGQQGQQAAPTSQRPAESQLAIIDTDIGDDIDDAFALALALRSPELNLLGITTAYGDTELRARLLDRFLSAVGESDMPVASGVPTAHGNVFTQAVYAGRIPKVTYADGVGFLLDQIRAHPGQITLIAIGPLFNVQAAIERDPDTFRKLRRVVMMGGSIYRGYDDGKTGAHRPADAEWNIKCDPAGARALLASGVPVFMMPLDSTQIHLETGDREAIFSHGYPLTDQLTLLYHQWLAGTEGHPAAPTLFDPVAVAYAVHPELCPATPMHLEVDEKGFTRPVEGAAPNAQVCLQSDEKGFLSLLLGRILNETAH